MPTTQVLVQRYLSRPSGPRHQFQSLSLQDVEDCTGLWSRVMKKPVKKYGPLVRRISSGKRNPIDNTSYQLRKVARAMKQAGHTMDDVLLLSADFEFFVRALYATDVESVAKISLEEAQIDAEEDVAQLQHAQDPSRENALNWRNAALKAIASLSRAVVAINRQYA
jgi:hypothetical protein